MPPSMSLLLPIKKHIETHELQHPSLALMQVKVNNSFFILSTLGQTSTDLLVPATRN